MTQTARVLLPYLRKWLPLAVLVGIAAGVGSILLILSISWTTHLLSRGIAGLNPPLPLGEGPLVVSPAARNWLLPLSTIVGGLILAFLMLGRGGWGIGAAIATALSRRRPPFFTWPVALLAAAFTIGSGGSAGREGSAALMCSTVASRLSAPFRLNEDERRVLMAVGVGAGMSSILRTPISGALLAAEILYVRGLEWRALFPGLVASGTGYVVFAAWEGWSPLFAGGPYMHFDEPQSLLWYLVLGVIAGLLGAAFVLLLDSFRFLARCVPVPRFLATAIGMLGVGFIALHFPQVLGLGYGWLQLAILGNTDQLAVSTMLLLIPLKAVATTLTMSTHRGGVFAPMVFVGGMVGATMWGLLHAHAGWLPDGPAPLVIVGMLALFGVVARTPLAAVVIVAEMTRRAEMVPPAVVAIAVAYFISGRVRLYPEQSRSLGALQNGQSTE